MSQKELNRLEILSRVREKRMTQSKAGEILGLGVRQVRRLVKALDADGPAGLNSKKRGRPSNRKLDPAFRERVIGLVKSNYADFGPTLANEKLEELHGIKVSTETLRQWMLSDGVWVTRARRRRIHQPRNRRDCLGELVQIDGSPHRWFEDRGPKCTLLVFVDDATSRLMELRFAPTETALDYFEAAKRYLKRHGKPVCFYSDKASIFRVSMRPGDEKVHTKTQFGRALDQLNIDIICANTPQAKGRVERANRTLQDRLVKELRLRGISTMEDGNAFAPSFMGSFNKRFAKPARDLHDAHRPLLGTDNLHDVLTLQAQRKISGDLVVHYKRRLYCLEPSHEAKRLARKQCTVHEWLDGTVEIRCEGHTLPFACFDKDWRESQTPIVPNKRLDASVQWSLEKQKKRLATEKLSDRITKREKERIRAQVGA